MSSVCGIIVFGGEVDISIFIAKNHISKTPSIQNTIFHTQIDGIPKDQLSTLIGFPNNSFPIISPGPNAKNNQAIRIIHALGLRLLLVKE